MKEENLLNAYAREDIIEEVLIRMDVRTGAKSGMGAAINELRLYKKFYTEEFNILINDMKLNLKEKFQNLNW